MWFDRPTARYSFRFHVFVSGANEDALKKVKHVVQYGVSHVLLGLRDLNSYWTTRGANQLSYKTLES